MNQIPSVASLMTILETLRASTTPALKRPNRPVVPKVVVAYIQRGVRVSHQEVCLVAFQFILDFIEAPPGAPEICRLRQPIAVLLSRLCHSQNVPSSETRTLLALSRLLIKAFTRSSSKPVSPDRLHHPLYFFLLAYAKNGSLGAFEHFGPICHHRIFNAPYQGNNHRHRRHRHRRYDLSLHLEAFLNCVPIPATPAIGALPCPTPDQIDAALRRLRSLRTGKRGGPLTKGTVENYHRTWTQSFQNTGWNPVGQRLINRLADETLICGDVPPSSLKTFNEDDEESPDGNTILQHDYGSIPTMALQEAVCGEEFATRSPTAPEADFPVKDLLTWIHHRELARYARVNSSVRYWWDRSCPTLSTDVQLWRLLPSQRPEAAVAWLIKQVGVHPDTAMGIRLLRDSALPSEGLFLDYQNKALRYQRPLDWCGFNSDQYLICLDGCEETTTDITIILPPIVWDGLVPYLEHRLAIDSALALTNVRDLLFVTRTDSPVALTTTDVNRFLRAQIPIPESLTLHALSRSFKLLYGGRCALDDIFLCYISGRVPQYLKAPLFYTRVTLGDLTRSYWAAAKQYSEMLLREIHAMGAQELDIARLRRALHHHGAQNHEALLNSAFGSKAVPRIGIVCSFFQEYRASLSTLAKATHLEEARRYFNQFMTHAFLAWGYGTAVRPVLDANLKDRHLMQPLEGNGLVLIADKDNQRFAESRFIPLTPTTDLFIKKALHARKIFTEYLDHRHGIPLYADLANLHWPVFFLVDSNWSILRLTPKTIREQLDDAGLSTQYRVPLNANRHFFRSHLRSRIHSGILHAVLGHQHQGREWWGRLSVSDLQEARAILSKEIEGMLQTLNIVPVDFGLNV